MQLVKNFLVRHWQLVTLYGGLFAILGTALFWRLGSLLPGYAQAEAETFDRSMAISDILDNPLNAPFLLAVRAFTFVLPDDFLATRLVATLCGLVVLSLFCWLLHQWHDRRTALLGTLLFGLSAWFLHIARLGTPEILMTGAFILVAAGFWLAKYRSAWALLTCFVLAALFLYVPGMVWFIVAGIVWQWKTIDHIFKNHLATVSIGALLMLVILAPLVWGLYLHKDLLMPWLGLPAEWPSALEIARNILAVPYHVAIAHVPDPLTWLGRAPLLDVFSVAMFIVGGYLYLSRHKLVRTPLFLSLLGVGVVLVSLQGAVTVSAIMPFIYLVVAAGIGYLLSMWLQVFPRNPIARGTGMIMLGIVVSLVCAYHIVHYFVGWPEARATHDTYIINKP